MKTWNSTGDWKAVDLDVVNSIVGSNQAVTLDKSCWPTWASTQTQRLFIFGPDEENPLNVPGSTARIVAGLLSERYDSKDQKPYNYNFYLVAESTGGQHYMSPPIRPINMRHHSSGPITLPESFGSPPF